MDIIKSLLSEIHAYCEGHQMAPTTFGRVVVNDGKFVERLEAGGQVTVKTIEKVRAVLDAPKSSAA